MRGPRISVIVPFCNNARHLAEAIRSVRAQTYAALDLILVDDGSTDGSAVIAQRHTPPARYVRRPNGGAGAARNSGLAHASGDLIAFCDADDVWAPTKLERQVAALEGDRRIDLVFCGVAEFRDDDRPERGIRGPRTTPHGASPSAILIRRAAFDRVGLFAEGLRIGEWFDWYVRMSETGLRVMWLPDPLVGRRLHKRNNGLLQGVKARIEYTAILRAHLHRQGHRDAHA